MQVKEEAAIQREVGGWLERTLRKYYQNATSRWALRED